MKPELAQARMGYQRAADENNPDGKKAVERANAGQAQAMEGRGTLGLQSLLE